MPEITYVLRGSGRTVYFGGDTLAIPQLRELPERFGHFDLALLPTNGLCVRPLNDQQVVMTATEAAELTAVLRRTWPPRTTTPSPAAGSATG